MCQQRKSELLYFLSFIKAGVNLPHWAVMCSCVIAQGAYTGLGCQSWGWQFSFCCSMGFWGSTFLSEPSSHLMGLGLSTARPPGVCVSLDWGWSPLFGEGCTTQEALLKIILHGKIVCNSVFQLSGNNSEHGRRGSQKKVVSRKVYDSAIILVYCLERAKIHCLKWEKNNCKKKKKRTKIATKPFVNLKWGWVRVLSYPGYMFWIWSWIPYIGYIHS